MEDIFEELAEGVSDRDSDIEEAIEVKDKQTKNGDGEGEARTVQPKKHVVRPRLKLDVPRLLGPRGISAVKASFEGVKFKGKGHELDDLNAVLFGLQHWTNRLFPKMTFEDCINRVEELGNKRPVMVGMHKLRMGIEEVAIEEPRVDDDEVDSVQPVGDQDEVDALFNRLVEQRPQSATGGAASTLTEEQRARMMRNRLIAEERRMARLEALRREKEAEELRSDVHQHNEAPERRSPVPSPLNDALESSVINPEVSLTD